MPDKPATDEEVVRLKRCETLSMEGCLARTGYASCDECEGCDVPEKLSLIARIEADAAELRLAREVVEAAKTWHRKLYRGTSPDCPVCAALARYEAGK